MALYQRENSGQGSGHSKAIKGLETGEGWLDAAGGVMDPAGLFKGAPTIDWAAYDPDQAGAQMDDVFATEYGARADAAQGRGGAGMDASLANFNAANQIRRNQMGHLEALQARAAGTAPSAAELQMQAGMERNLRGQLAAANTQRGGRAGAQARLIGDQANAAQLQTNQQLGQLRAAEQAQAEQALTQAMAGMRGQDVGQAQFQAGQLQGAGQANLGADMQQRQLNDQLTMRYMAEGRSQAEAEMMARMQLEGMRVAQSDTAATVASQEAGYDIQKDAANANMVSSMMSGLM